MYATAFVPSPRHATWKTFLNLKQHTPDNLFDTNNDGDGDGDGDGDSQLWGDKKRRAILQSPLAGLIMTSTIFAVDSTGAVAVAETIQQQQQQQQQQRQQADNDTASTMTATTTTKGESLTVPLKWIPSLSAYVVYYSVGGERFGAIIDTGSPFLVVPHYCNPQGYGCYRPDQSRPALGLPPTLERFDNNQGLVEWRTAPFSFLQATPGSSMMMGPSEMVFGVLSESLMNGPGGVFLGLIRDTDDWIRPSFLGQTNVRAMEIDLRNDNVNQTTTTKSLTLYTQSPFSWRTTSSAYGSNSEADYIPLVRDLNQKYGDPVVHYTAKAMAVLANGNPILTTNTNNNNNKQNNKKPKPIYVIFDTGVTGMVVSRELFDERYTTARQNKEKSLWGTVQVVFETHHGKQLELTARNPVTTPLGMKPWPKFQNAYLVVLGLAFLDGHQLTIDMDQQKLQIE